MNIIDANISLETRSFRTFRSNEEYLYAMKEDLAEWLNRLYHLDLNVDNFIEMLENGVILCRHANNVINQAKKAGDKIFDDWLKGSSKANELVYLINAKPKTFQARDNVSKFISWCRCLRVHECLLFETDDLVLAKNEKVFILCLLEVARKSSKFGLEAPLLVQIEQEMDRELNCPKENSKPLSSTLDDNNNIEQTVYLDASQSKPEPQIITNNLKCLHERVVDLLNKCTCSVQFPMVKVEDGKYRVGNTKVLILVRVLRNHVMVRVGGGWDTLGHYLERHDPCRTRSQQKLYRSVFTPRFSTTKLHQWANYERNIAKEPQFSSLNSLKSDSVSTLYINYDRRDSMGLTESSGSLNSYVDSNECQSSRASYYSDDSSCSNTSASCLDPLSPSYCTDLKGRQVKGPFTNLGQSLKSAKRGIPTLGGLSRSFISGSCTNLKTCQHNWRLVKHKSH